LQSFSHCGFFKHRDLKSLNDYQIFFLILLLWFKTNLGVEYAIGNVFSRPFQWYITNPQIPNIVAGRQKKTNMHSNSWVLDVPHCGRSIRGRACKKWYVSWAMIWSRHVEGGIVSQDSVHHIDAEKCALWALPSERISI
jgi:hypothetical protein